MSHVHSKGTKPEVIVRKYLWNHGFRYRMNHPRLPGKPDIVLRKYRSCVFINGCFWHGHGVSVVDGNISTTEGKCFRRPHTNSDFWNKKIVRNKQRDADVQRQLAKMGWHCITIWECELNERNRDATLASLVYTLNKIYLQDHSSRKYEIPENDELQMVAEERSFEH